MNMRAIGYVGAAFCSTMLAGAGGVTALAMQKEPVSQAMWVVTIVFLIIGAAGAMFGAMFAYNDQTGGEPAPPIRVTVSGETKSPLIDTTAANIERKP